MTAKDMNAARIVIIIAIIAIVIVASYSLTSGLLGKKDDLQVSWLVAARMMQDGEVKEVVQYEDLVVRLLLKDGKVIKTAEPMAGAILSEKEKCGQACNDIIIRDG